MYTRATSKVVNQVVKKYYEMYNRYGDRRLTHHRIKYCGALRPVAKYANLSDEERCILIKNMLIKKGVDVTDVTHHWSRAGSCWGGYDSLIVRISL